MLLSRKFHGAGIDQMSTTVHGAQSILTATLPAYFRWIVADLKGFPGVFAAGAVIAFLVWIRKPVSRAPELALYFGWALALGGVLGFLQAVSDRYLFFVLPAAIAIGYAWLFRGCSRLWGERRAVMIAAGFAVVWFMAGLFVPVDFLRGPGASAAVVVRGTPERVLYAGEADGNFIFAVRSLDPRLQTIVVPAGKLPPKTFEPQALDAFCRQFGIDWVVLENSSSQQHPWLSLRDSRPASLTLERSIPLESNRLRWASGTMEIYRFTGSSGHPAGKLDIPVRKLGSSIRVKF